MEVLIIIGIIILVIWLFSGNNSSANSTYSPQTPSYSFSSPFVKLAKQYHDLAWKEAEKGNHKEAIDYYDKAISYNSNATYYNNRAFSKSKYDNYNGAIEDYSKAIQLAPLNALYWLNRGFTHGNNNRYDLACSDWKKAKELGSEKAKEMFEKHNKQKTVAQQAPLVINTNRNLKAFTSSANNENKLNQYKINYLYHMTHKSNLENILINGLLSHNEAHNGYNQTDIADNIVNSIREKKETIYNRTIHDYVPLYFNPKNPMLFRRRNIQNDIIILAIDKNILSSNNTLFTNGNAASHTTSFFNSLDQLSQLNWQCINDEYWNDYTDGKRIKCAEVLVFPKIEVSSIKKIFCNNQVTLNFVNSKIRTQNSLRAEINNYLYFNNSSSFNFESFNEPLDDLPF